MKNLTDGAPAMIPEFGRRYPWDDWFRRAKTRPLTIYRGTDYVCMPHGMDQMIRNAAARDRYRLRVSVHIHPDESITLRVVGRLAPSRPRRSGGKRRHHAAR